MSMVTLKRRFSFALLAILIGLTVGIVVAEISLRALGYQSEFVYSPNPFYGWSHIPSSSYTKTNISGTDVTIRINSHGLRDTEYNYKKPSDIFRVLVLGDSFAEALQVTLADSFAKIIENKLQAYHAANFKYSGVQVLNAGVSGYGTDNELLFFQHEGFKYRPDIVVLAFYVGNDVRNNWRELEIIDAGGDRKPYFLLGSKDIVLEAFPFHQHGTLKARAKVLLNRYVRTYAFLRNARNQLRHLTMKENVGNLSNIPLDLNLFTKNTQTPWDNALKVTKCLIVKLNRTIELNGGRLFVTLIPTQFQVHAKVWDKMVTRYSGLDSSNIDLSAPNRVLSDFLTHQKIPFVDLLPTFREYAVSSGITYYLEGDGHWNSAGHELAGEIITSSIKSVIGTPAGISNSAVQHTPCVY